MSAYISNGKKPRGPQTPYIPPAARGTLKGKNKESTPSPGCSTQDTHDEDSWSSNSEVASDKRGNIGQGHDNEKIKSVDCPRKTMTAGGATATTSTTILREASERQLSGYPASKGRDRGQDGGTARVVSGSSSFVQHSDGAVVHGTTVDAIHHSPPAAQHREDALDSRQSNRKPRQAWSLYEPPGRRSAPPSCSSGSNDSKQHLSAGATAALSSRAKSSRETAVKEHTKESAVAPEESFRGPPPPNATTEPPGCPNVTSAQKLSAAGGSEVLTKGAGEEADVDTVLSTGTGTLAARNLSSNPDTASGMTTYPNESQQKEVPRGGGAGLGVKQTPRVFPTGRCSFPEPAHGRSQKGKTADNRGKSGGALEERNPKRGVENGGVVSEALATLTPSTGDVSDRTRVSNVKEERAMSQSPTHHVGEAAPMHVHEEEKNIAPAFEGGATPEVGAPGDISPFTERDTSGSVEASGRARIDGTSNNDTHNSEASSKCVDFGGGHVNGKSNPIGCSPETTTAIGASRTDPAPEATATSSTPIPLPEASERQLSAKSRRDRGQDGSTAKVVSRSRSCRQHADGSFVPSTTPGSPQSNRKPRQGWAVYQPPGRRVASSYTCSSKGNDSTWHSSAGVDSAPESGAKSSREKTTASGLLAKALVTEGHTKDDSVALENSLREPAPTNAITEPPGCQDAGLKHLTAAEGSEVLMGIGHEGAEIDTALSTGVGRPVGRNLPSSNLDTGSDMIAHPNKAQQNEVPHGRGAAFGVKQSPCVSPDESSSSPERAGQKFQEGWTAESGGKSGGASEKGARERGDENGDVTSEALATLTSSSWGVSDQTPASKVKEERVMLQSPAHHAGEALPMHVHDVEKNAAPTLKGGVRSDVGARGDISPFTERDTSGSVESKGSARVDGKGNARGIDSGGKDIGVEVDGGGSQGKPTSKAPMERYIPPNRRRMLDAAARNADSASEWMGPLWTSRAPIRVRQKERPSDGQTSESSSGRPAPAKIAGVVRGGMSAYGANISEYSEQMSREQVEECTALITNFPSALPPGQREPMLESFHSFGALITWPRPDEALATFATPSLARQAVSERANRSTVLVVELLSDVSVEKRKWYRKIELARPGRPPADVSSASRLITGSLGIRRLRERSADNSNSSFSRTATRSRARGHGARKTQATESTDSWDM